MQLSYFPETDTLAIDLTEIASSGSREVADGIVLDCDASGCLVGTEIDQASLKVDLAKLVLQRLPSAVETVAA